MNTHPVDQYLRTLTRRQLFQRVGLGVGWARPRQFAEPRSLSRPRKSILSLCPQGKKCHLFSSGWGTFPS